MKFKPSYIWIVIILLIGSNIFGFGNDFQVEFQIIWLLLAALCYQVSRIMEKIKC